MPIFRWHSINLMLLKNIYLFNLFIYGCAGSLLLQRPSPVAVSGGCCSLVSVRGFSCCRAQAVGHVGFTIFGSQALEHRLGSCGTRA